jgi:hypothetical protein
MTSKLTISILDYDKETSTVAIRGDDVTAGTFTAQEALSDAIVTAISGVSLGTLYKNERTYAVNESAKTPPAAKFAQRETKWLVSYTDNTNPTGDGSFEIPCADLDLLVGNSKELPLGSGAGAALVSALQAGMVSKLGNPITITRVIHVGRNIKCPGGLLRAYPPNMLQGLLIFPMIPDGNQ